MMKLNVYRALCCHRGEFVVGVWCFVLVLLLGAEEGHQAGEQYTSVLGKPNHHHHHRHYNKVPPERVQYNLRTASSEQVSLCKGIVYVKSLAGIVALL